MNIDFPGFSLIKIPLKYGLIAGFIYSIQMNILHLLRFSLQDFDLYSPYLSLLITGIFIVMGIQEKIKFYEGKMSYLTGLQTCLLIALVFACISGFFVYIYSEYINSDWLDIMVEKARAGFKEQGMSNEEIRRMLKPVYHRYSTTYQVERQFVISMIGGTFFSFIAPLVSSKKRRENQSYNRF